MKQTKSIMGDILKWLQGGGGSGNTGSGA